MQCPPVAAGLWEAGMRVAERIASRGEGGGWARMFYSVNRGGLYSSASASGTK